MRKEDIRALVAQTYATMAVGMPPGTLRNSQALRGKLLDFASDTLRYLATSTTAGECWCIVFGQVEYCLCAARHICNLVHWWTCRSVGVGMRTVKLRSAHMHDYVCTPKGSKCIADLFNLKRPLYFHHPTLIQRRES